jgi:hypothetical protein
MNRLDAQIRHAGIKPRNRGNEKREDQFKCAEGATEISPGLEQRDYPG